MKYLIKNFQKNLHLKYKFEYILKNILKFKNMTTTDEFQKVKDYYLSIEEYKNLEYPNTNPRYKFYRQTHFTVGDEEQFNQYRDFTTKEYDKNIIPKENIYKDKEIENIDWEKYQKLDAEDVNNTFRYIFNKFKKGIYIKIRKNQLRCFLPFSKSNYINEWSDFIKIDKSRFKDIFDFLKYCAKCQGIIIDDKKINKFINSWYGNNCLIRPEFPIGEGDSGNPNIKDMLIELCKNRKVPDIELFINRRDFPIIKKDLTEPYDSIFNSTNYPLISHKFEKYCPILSMTTTDLHADIPIPTIEDWARVSSLEDGKYFIPPRNFNYDFSKSFKDKKNQAVFRGASTGEGTTINTNPRLKLASLDGKIKSLDAGITKWNTRCRKEFGKEFLTTIEPDKLKLPLKNFLSPEEQSRYKYVINVDGHSTAYRLSLELSMGSVVLLRKSKYRIWYSKYLKEYEHYVPLKEDLSDLKEKIEWCEKNQDECEKIAKSSLEFYNKYLSKDGILDYLQNLFYKLNEKIGFYFSDNYVLTINQKFQKENNIKSGLIFKDSKNKFNFEKLKEDEYKIIIENYKSKIKENCSFYFKKGIEIDNDCFIGQNCINFLTKFCPNYRWTYGIKNDELITDKIEGILFSDWLKEKFNIMKYIYILIQLSLILEMSQNFCLFIHRDLYPWNIIIKESDKPIEINYPIFGKGVYKVSTHIYPVLIDYGKSKAVYNDIYYGYNNLFEFKSFQDCITILFSSLYITIHNNLGPKQIELILGISNLFYKTKSIGMLKAYLNIRKKYNEIINGNTDIDMDQNPINLYEHLIKLIDGNNNLFKVNLINRYEFPCDEKLNINLNNNTLYDIYLMNINKKYEKVNWEGCISIDDYKELKINDYIFSDIFYLNEIIPKMYKGTLTGKKLFKLFNLILIDRKLKNITDIKKFLYNNINYKKYLKWICDSKSLLFYGEEILDKYIKFLK